MSYCRTLSDRQVNNVYWDEKARVARFAEDSPTARAALELMREAEVELARRGKDPDRAAWEKSR
jgi:hypothetical protein